MEFPYFSYAGEDISLRPTEIGDLSSARDAVILARKRKERTFSVCMTEGFPDDLRATVVLLQRLGAFAVGFRGTPAYLATSVLQVSSVAEAPLLVDFCGDTALTPSAFAALVRRLIRNGVAVFYGVAEKYRKKAEGLRAEVDASLYDDFYDLNSNRMIERKKFYLATQRRLFEMSYEMELASPCEISALPQRGFDGRLIPIRIRSAADAAQLCATESRLPLCVTAANAELAAEVARRYCGMLLIRGNCGLSMDEAECLVRDYGVLIV